MKLSALELPAVLDYRRFIQQDSVTVATSTITGMAFDTIVLLIVLYIVYIQRRQLFKKTVLFCLTLLVLVSP